MMWFKAVIIGISLVFCATGYAQDRVQDVINEGNLDDAGKMLEAMAGNSETETAISGLCGQAQLAMAQQDYMVAMAKLEEAAPLLPELKKKNGWRAVVPWLKADVARYQNDPVTCKHELNAAREAIHDGVKLNSGWIGAIEYLSSMCETDSSDARDYAENAIKAFDKAKMPHEKGLAELRLAGLEFERGKERRAFKEYDSAIQAFREANTDLDRQLTAETLVDLVEKMSKSEENKNLKQRLASAKDAVEAIGNPAALKQRLDDVAQNIE